MVAVSLALFIFNEIMRPSIKKTYVSDKAVTRGCFGCLKFDAEKCRLKFIIMTNINAAFSEQLRLSGKNPAVNTHQNYT